MHGPSDAVVELLVVLVAAALGAAVFERLRLPAVAGFLAIGAVVGPGGLALVRDPERVRTLADFGVALLLFEIGLELPLEELRRTWRTALLAGLLQVAATVASVTWLGAALGLRTESALVLGMLVSLSSTALVMRVLAQRGEVDAPHGRLSLGILLFQDLCIVPYLLAVPLLSGEVPAGFAPMALAVGRAAAALALLFAVARFVLPWLLERVVRLRAPDLFSLFAFLLAVGSAVLAEWLGLGLAVGAFVAGLVVSASPYAQQLFAEVIPLRGVLLGIFFTAVGMLLDPARAAGALAGIGLYVAGVVVLKAAVVVAILALVLRAGLRAAVQTGLALAQTGEFSFVLAAAATRAGLLEAELGQIFVTGSIVTLSATPFLIRGSARIAGVVQGGAERLGTRHRSDHDVPADHVVVVGFGFAGRALAKVLKAQSIAYRVVDANPQRVEHWRGRNEPVLFGDATRPAILARLGVPRARLVSIAISDPVATRSVVQLARALAPHVPILVRARYMQEVDDLLARGASHVVAEELESSLDLLSQVLRRFDVPQHAVARFAEELRAEGYELLRGPASVTLDPWLSELLDEVQGEWIEVPPRRPSTRSSSSPCASAPA